MKKELKREMEKVQLDLQNSLSEINRNGDQVRRDMATVLAEVRNEHKNIKAEVDQLKEYVQKIFQLSVEMRYKVMLRVKPFQIYAPTFPTFRLT